MESIHVAIPVNGDEILIAGEFTSYNGIGRNRVARLYTSTLTTGPTVSGSYYQINSISIPYTATGGYLAGNAFMALMSDKSGSFNSPMVALAH
jgi:hypothetical protein